MCSRGENTGKKTGIFYNKEQNIMLNVDNIDSWNLKTKMNHCVGKLF